MSITGLDCFNQFGDRLPSHFTDFSRDLFILIDGHVLSRMDNLCILTA